MDPDYDPDADPGDSSYSDVSTDDEAATGNGRSQRHRMSKAVVTPLVKEMFRVLYANQIKDVDDLGFNDDRTCGICTNCLREDCGRCDACLDNDVFRNPSGGANAARVCRERICLELDVAEMPADSGQERLNNTQGHHWIRVEIVESLINSCHPAALVDGTRFEVGDFALMPPERGAESSSRWRIGRIMGLFRHSGQNLAHVQFFARGVNTVLGMLADEKELFETLECGEVYLRDLRRRVHVTHRSAERLFGNSGDGCGNQDWDGVADYWYRFRYDKRQPTFITAPMPTKSTNYAACTVCKAKSRERLIPKPVRSRLKSTSSNESEAYDMFRLGEETIRIGDSVYLDSATYKMPNYSRREPHRKKKDIRVDRNVFTEYYRFDGSRAGEAAEQLPDPFLLAVVEGITQATPLSEVKLRVRKLYRPENVYPGAVGAPDHVRRSDFNLVYWSQDFIEDVPARAVRGKCVVRPLKALADDGTSLSSWFNDGSDRFYFEARYLPGSKRLEVVPREVYEHYACRGRYPASEGAHPRLDRPLRAFDVFCGCGGLSEGLEASSACTVEWGVEIDPAAATSYRINLPMAKVLNVDCNTLLEKLIGSYGGDDSKVFVGAPRKGDVELICGGPPCPGFSSMNHFNEREYSMFKNSLVASFLSLCDYYRPKFFLLENVRNFANYKKSLVLKLCIRTLLAMGYQCTFGALQTGNFGVPQQRLRFFILAAAPGQVLPQFPEIRHVFTPSGGPTGLEVRIDGKTYAVRRRWTTSAPCRAITVRDAISDLPYTEMGVERAVERFRSEPISHYQRLVRTGSPNYPPEIELYDHVTRDFSALNRKRMELIPREPGSDWRDLPNKSVTLCDGTVTEKLVYSYLDNKGQRTGVCGCQKRRRAGDKRKKFNCDTRDKQDNTLIPWSVVHTADTHGHWSGVFGRLDPEGFFSTTLTKPDPKARQGRVLHPEQNRVVSVRECARSQGFPDRTRFAGNINERYAQVGNAVPPPLAAALGLELRKAAAKVRDVEILDLD